MEILTKFYRPILCLAIAVIIPSCSSEDSFDCVKKSGKLTTVRIDDFEDFAQLVIYDNIELEIAYANEEFFELTYGENLIPKIIVEQKNDSLSFFNQNGCGWTRDFEKPKLKWFTYKTTINIISLSNGNINSSDTIKSDLSLRMEDATNKITLKLNNNNTTLSTNSISNFTVGGQSKSLRIRNYFNDGKIDCENLIVNRADVLHRGYNDITVNVTDSLIGSIENAGRILYKGNPGVDVAVSNGGALIHLDQE